MLQQQKNKNEKSPLSTFYDNMIKGTWFLQDLKAKKQGTGLTINSHVPTVYHRSVHQIIGEDRFQIAAGSTFCFVDDKGWLLYSNLAAMQSSNIFYFMWSKSPIEEVWWFFSTFTLPVKDLELFNVCLLLLIRRLCLCVGVLTCVCVCGYAHMSACVWVCSHDCLCVGMLACVCVGMLTCVCVCRYAHMSACVPSEAGRGCQILWTWSYRQSWAIDVNAETQTWGPWKSSQRSYSWSISLPTCF